MGQSNHAGSAVHMESLDHVIGHARQERDPGHLPAAAVLLAGITNRDGKATKQSHGRQVFRQLPGTYQQHAVLRAETVGQREAIVCERLRLMGSGQGHLPRGHVCAAMHHLSVGEHVHQRFQFSHTGVEFEHKLQGAATGQTKTVRFVGTDTIGHTFGRFGGNVVRLVFWR